MFFAKSVKSLTWNEYLRESVASWAGSTPAADMRTSIVEDTTAKPLAANAESASAVRPGKESGILQLDCRAAQ
jgi:hypothetical protein